MAGNTWTLANVSSEVFMPYSLLHHLTLASVISSVGLKGVLLPLAGTALLVFLLLPLFQSPARVDAPIVGYRSLLEPTLLLRLRFLFGARDIIREGYAKVNMTVVGRPAKNYLELTCFTNYSTKMPSSMFEGSTSMLLSFPPSTWTSYAWFPTRN